MRGRGWTVVLLASVAGLAGCERPITEDDRLAREGAEHAAAISLPPSPPPPPPPPPPPEPQTTLPPPVELATFVRANAAQTAPWRVTLYELADRAPRRPGRLGRFMGAHVVRRRALSRGASVWFVANLVRPIYADGDCGCWTDRSLGIHITRGAASIDLVYNSAHLFLTPAWHDGPFALLYDTEWIGNIAARVGL